MAVGACAAVRDRGMVVGQDVSISGFDNNAFAEYCQPSLTSVHNPAYEIGQTLCRMLAQAIAGDHPKPKLVVRQSTGPASPHD